MSSKIGKYDIDIVQGADINDLVIIPKESDGTPIDLLGFTAKLQIRPDVRSKTILDTLTTENSRITIIKHDGDEFWEITIKFPSSVTAKYSFKSATYSLEIYHGTLVDRYLQGMVNIDID